MNVRLGGKTSQASCRLLWMLMAGLLALVVVLGVWVVPSLAAPLSTAAAVLGGAVTTYTAWRGSQKSAGGGGSDLVTKVEQPH